MDTFPGSEISISGERQRGGEVGRGEMEEMELSNEQWTMTNLIYFIPQLTGDKHV